MGWKSTITVEQAAARDAIIAVASSAGPKMLASLMGALLYATSYNATLVDADEAKRLNAQEAQGDVAVIEQGSAWLASLVDDLKSAP